jgi:hypothetical protein
VSEGGRLCRGTGPRRGERRRRVLSSWALYESGALHPDVELTGYFEHVETTVDLESIMREIDSARLEEAARQMRLQERG